MAIQRIEQLTQRVEDEEPQVGIEANVEGGDEKDDSAVADEVGDEKVDHVSPRGLCFVFVLSMNNYLHAVVLVGGPQRRRRRRGSHLCGQIANWFVGDAFKVEEVDDEDEDEVVVLQLKMKKRSSTAVVVVVVSRSLSEA